MRKTKKGKLGFFILRVSLLSLLFILLLVGYIVLLVFFAPVSSIELENEIVFVEETKFYGRQALSDTNRFYFYSQNIEYEVVGILEVVTNDHSMHQLDEKVKPGDRVIVDYIDNDGIREVYNLWKSNEQLRSLDGVNTTLLLTRISITILFVFIEALILIFIYFNIMFGIDDLKRYRKAKQKKNEQKR